jgi:hypothetical protein
MSNPNTQSREVFLLAVSRTDNDDDLDILFGTRKDDDDAEWEDLDDDE